MNDIQSKLNELYERYQKIADEGDHKGTASDFKLRELEISYASNWISSTDDVLDVGCGYGYALSKYA